MAPAARVVVAGASGFIGRAVVRELAGAGFSVAALTRDPSAARRHLPEGVSAVGWDGRGLGDWAGSLDGARAVINLTGDSLARGRWTKAKKRLILESRIGPGAALVEAVGRARERPRIFVQASAVGFYGSPGEIEVDESSPRGSGFLAGIVERWEASTAGVEALGVRRVIVRSGLVLGRGGGVWPSLERPFRFFVGGPLGSGRQWFSWITLEDEVRALLYLLAREDLAGVFNLAAPDPIRQRDLCRTMARALRRPCWIPVPAFALRLLFGQKAGETILVSQRVRPRRLLESGFVFRYPEEAQAVAALVR